jgi:hypothetical protein
MRTSLFELKFTMELGEQKVSLISHVAPGSINPSMGSSLMSAAVLCRLNEILYDILNLPLLHILTV